MAAIYVFKSTSLGIHLENKFFSIGFPWVDNDRYQHYLAMIQKGTIYLVWSGVHMHPEMNQACIQAAFYLGPL